MRTSASNQIRYIIFVIYVKKLFELYCVIIRIVVLKNEYKMIPVQEKML